MCISLVKSAGTKSCHLCGAEHMILGQSLTNVHRRTKILNLKSKMRGNCSCKTRFLRFLQSDQERGALMRVRYAPKQSSSLTGGTGWESYFTFHQYCTSNTTPLLFEWASFGRVFRERGGQKKSGLGTSSHTCGKRITPIPPKVEAAVFIKRFTVRL